MAKKNVLDLSTTADTTGAEKDVKKFSAALEKSPVSLTIDIDLSDIEAKAQKQMKDLAKSLQSTLDKENIQLSNEAILSSVKDLIIEEEKLADIYLKTKENAEQLLQFQKEVQSTASGIFTSSSKDTSSSAIEQQEELMVSLGSLVEQIKTAYAGLSSAISNANVSKQVKKTGSDLETVLTNAMNKLNTFPTLLTNINKTFGTNLNIGISNEKYALSSCKGTDAQTQKCWENNKKYYLATA